MIYSWGCGIFLVGTVLVVILGNIWAWGFETGHNYAEDKFAPCEVLAYERAGKDLPERCR